VNFYPGFGFNHSGIQLLACGKEMVFAQYEFDSSVYTTDHPFMPEDSINRASYPYVFSRDVALHNTFSFLREENFASLRENQYFNPSRRKP
jgi:hypothetical protein